MMSEAEVRTMDSEQLAQYALESKIANYVAETIKTNEIDGDLAYALNEEDISEFAGKSGVQKKRLLSAIGKLPRDGGGPDSVELMANAAEELEGERAVALVVPPGVVGAEHARRVCLHAALALVVAELAVHVLVAAGGEARARVPG